MPQPTSLRLIAAGTIGNVLEWYDFAIYGYFAISIGQTFFPGDSAVAQVLAAFGIFAIGSIMRPLGGMLTGYIGDRYGRRTALTVSVSAMAATSFLLGLLPGYATLGLAAPAALTLLRMIQGLSAGGECTTAFTYMIENSKPHRRGLIGGIACASMTLGTLLGSGVGALVAGLLTVDQLHVWGWRIPFLSGLAVGVVGWFLRRRLEDSYRPPESSSPIADTFRNHKGLVGRIAALNAFAGSTFFLMFLYVASWLQVVDGIAPAQALSINTVSIAAVVLVEVFAGWLSDRVGRKPLLTAALAVGLVTAVPIFWLLHHPGLAMILLGQLVAVLVTGFAIGGMPALLVESTPQAVRCTTIALGYNAAFGMIGGLTPLAAAWLVHRTGTDLSPSFLMMAAAAISLVAAFFFKETAPAKARAG